MEVSETMSDSGHDGPVGAIDSAIGDPDGFDISVSWTDRIVVLSVFGSLDMESAPQLSESIGNALVNEPAAILVDLSGVEFLASAGMTVLVAAKERTRDAVNFGVVADGPAIGRPMRLVGLDKELTMYSDVDSALAAMSTA